MAMEVEVQRIGPDYVVRHEQGIVLTFSRLHESKEDIVGMLEIKLQNYAGRDDGVLFDSRIILTGPRSKSDAANACSKRVGEFTLWSDLVERACIEVRRGLAMGNPWVDLGNGELAPKPPPLIAPLWMRNEHAILFGDGGSGKSKMTLLFATLLSAGIDGAGLEVPAPQRVGVVDFEDDEDTFRWRLNAIARGLGLEQRPQVFYKRGDATMTGMADGLSRSIAELGIDGIIVDSVGVACGAEPEAAQAANEYFRVLRSLPIKWSISIAHQTKDKAKAMEPFGSIFWKNGARNIWKAVAEQQTGSNVLNVGMMNTKANNRALEKAVAFAITHDEDKIVVRRQDGIWREELVNQASLRVQILSALQHAPGPLTPQEIADWAGVKVNSVGPTLKRMGDVVKAVGGGRYAPVEEGLSAPPPTNGHVHLEEEAFPF